MVFFCIGARVGDVAMQEEDLFVFRSDDEERVVIAERNKQAAASILSQAGISEDNPLYNQYYAHTLANVHHAGRYGGYDKQIEQMFVETLQDPELSLEQYIEASKRFEAQFAEKQMQNADGSVFNWEKNNTPFQEMRGILNKTTLDGVEMRKNQNTTFPKEFYDENGSLKRRLVVEIPPELMGNSAMGAIGSITKEYKNISFDRASNSFMVKGKPIGPEKFFKNKKELLDKFDAEKLDMSDTELLGVLQEGDYNKFLELRKNRGMNRDRRNEMLRNVLNDEVVLGEVSKKFRNTELNKQNISDVVKSVADDFGSKAQIVRIESEKATLGGIDRVMFSVSPADVARQSTFQDWKSCMHAVGCNHQYVDDSIGVGSIIAYGYSSDEPQKMVSRLLIHPYTSNKGTVAYGVNDRIYGKENLAFREVVNKVVTEKFNAGKVGAFKLNENLYNDNAGKNILRLFPSDMKNVNWHDFIVDGKVDLSNYSELNLNGADFSQVENLILPEHIKSLEGIKLPKKLDLSNCSELNLAGADFSQVEELELPYNIKSLEGAKLPKKLDLSNCPELNLVGVDFSQVEDLKLPNNIKSLEGITFSKKLDLSDCAKLNLNGADLSHFEEVKLSNHIKSLEGMKFPKKLDLSNCLQLNLNGADLSQVEELELPNNIESLEGAKLPKKLDLSNCWQLNLNGADLSQVEDLKFPSSIGSLEGTKFPKNVDFSRCQYVNLAGVDLSQVEELKLPDSIGSLEGTKFPKKVDFSNCYRVNFAGADLSQVEDLKLPSSIESLEGTKFPKKVDFSNCYTVNFAGADFSQVEDLKLPSGIKSLEGVKLPKKLDISSCYNLNLEGVDLSTVENLKVSSCENMDLSNFNGNLEFSQKNISIMNSKLPPSLKSLDLSGGMALISETNLDGIEELKLPEHVISGNMDDAEKKMMELCDGNASKLESMAVAVITPESVPNNLKRLDISACKDIDLRNWNLDKIEDLKLPKDFDVSKLPEGIVEKNPAVARAVKISRGEAVEDLVQTSVGKENAAISEPKAEVKAKNATAERISQLRGVNQSSAAAKTGENIIEKVAEKTVVHAGVNAGKTSEGIIDTLAKADNAVNQAIDKTIDKGSELLNNTAVGKVYEKATDAIANTKVVKAVEKGAAKTVEKAAQTAVGKSVVKTVAKTTGSAVGKSVLKKVPLVSVAAGCYFAWDRAKDGDWKGACGEIASGIAGCFPGVGTAASAAIDVGLAAKDISGAIAEAKEPEASKSVTEEDSGKSKEDMRQIILQKQGRVAAESKTPVKSSEISNQVLQQRMVQQGRG